MSKGKILYFGSIGIFLLVFIIYLVNHFFIFIYPFIALSIVLMIFYQVIEIILLVYGLHDSVVIDEIKFFRNKEKLKTGENLKFQNYLKDHKKYKEIVLYNIIIWFLVFITNCAVIVGMLVNYFNGGFVETKDVLFSVIFCFILLIVGLIGVVISRTTFKKQPYLFRKIKWISVIHFVLVSLVVIFM